MAMNKKDTEIVREIKRHMKVLMEDMSGQVKIVAEQHGSIIRKLEEHDARFDRMDLEFQKVHMDLKVITTGLFDTSHRVDDHEARIRKLELAEG